MDRVQERCCCQSLREPDKAGHCVNRHLAMRSNTLQLGNDASRKRILQEDTRRCLNVVPASVDAGTTLR